MERFIYPYASGASRWFKLDISKEPAMKWRIPSGIIHTQPPRSSFPAKHEHYNAEYQHEIFKAAAELRQSFPMQALMKAVLLKRRHDLALLLLLEKHSTLAYVVAFPFLAMTRSGASALVGEKSDGKVSFLTITITKRYSIHAGIDTLNFIVPIIEEFFKKAKCILKSQLMDALLYFLLRKKDNGT